LPTEFAAKSRRPASIELTGLVAIKIIEHAGTGEGETMTPRARRQLPELIATSRGSVAMLAHVESLRIAGLVKSIW
jgi:hypothetical protein